MYYEYIGDLKIAHNVTKYVYNFNDRNLEDFSQTYKSELAMP